MRKISAVFFGCLLVALMQGALGAQFWVAGSFESLPKASNEKRRLEASTDLSLQIGTFNREGVTFYRLLVEKDATAAAAQREQLMRVGVEPWTLSLNPGVLDLAADDTDSAWAQYLVLAGFRSEPRAREFVDRLRQNNITDLGIDEIVMGGSPYFRVLYGPFDMQAAKVREKVRAMGIDDAWWVTKAVEKERVVELSPPPQPKEPEEPVEPEAPEEPIISMSPPKPGQSYFDYCIKEANSKERARYCDDGKFMSVAVKGEQAKQGALSSEEYFLFCTKEATASQRLSYCTDDRFEEQLGELKALR